MYSKYAACMDNDGKYAKHTRHINKRVHSVINGEKWKIPKIDSCEGGLQLADIATKNIGENYLNTRMKYNIKAWKLMEKHFKKGMTGYSIVCGTRFLYD